MAKIPRSKLRGLRKRNHTKRIQGSKNIPISKLENGMIITFDYNAKKIFDEKK